MKRAFLFRALLVAFSGFLLITNDTQAQLSVDAEYRPRFEFRDGYRKLLSEGATPCVVASQRMRLSVSYRTEGLRLYFTPQDVRVWGEEQMASSTGVFGDEASLDLFEGYAEIELWEDGWISVGRQPISYDNQRLLSIRNWNQNGLTYDAVLLKTKMGSWNLHAGTSWNNLAASTSNNLYLPERIKSLNFVWLNREFSNDVDVSLMHISSGVTETDSTNTLHFRHTSGVYSTFSRESFNLEAGFYYQYGKNRTGTDVRAFLFDADAALKLGDFTPGVGFSYLSGNNETNPSIDKLFDVLYGARHGYFGHMDYFLDMNTHTNGGGLSDWFGYLGYKVSNKLSIKNTTNFFSLAQTNNNTPDEKYLGIENELELKYKFREWGMIKTAWLFYVPTDSFRQLQGVANEKFPQFAYLELTLTPGLL